MALIPIFISMSGYNVDNLSFDIEWLLEHVAVIVNDISIGKSAVSLYTSPSPRDGLLSRMPSSA